MAFNRNLLATAAAIVLLVLSAPSDQAGAVPPETGVWSVGASAGVIGDTPEDTAFALNLQADNFLNQDFSLGPLLQLGVTSGMIQLGLSGQAKYWMDLHIPNRDAKLVLQGGLGFLHSKGDTSWLLPFRIGVDYPVDRKMSLMATFLLNFTGVDAGLGNGTHLMPSITVGVRF